MKYRYSLVSNDSGLNKHILESISTNGLYLNAKHTWKLIYWSYKCGIKSTTYDQKTLKGKSHNTDILQLVYHSKNSLKHAYEYKLLKTE